MWKTDRLFGSDRRTRLPGARSAAGPAPRDATRRTAALVRPSAGPASRQGTRTPRQPNADRDDSRADYRDGTAGAPKPFPSPRRRLLGHQPVGPLAAPTGFFHKN